MSVQTRTYACGIKGDFFVRYWITRRLWMNGLTMAMQRATPTMMSPSRSSGRSGKNAHASPSMSRGETIQLIKTEKARCCHSCRFLSSGTSDVGETRHRIGHIMTIKAMAAENVHYLSENMHGSQDMQSQCSPKGSETSTNLTFSSTTDVEGTNSPRMMPTAIARKIQTASNLSSQASRFKAGLSDVAWPRM